MSSYLLRLFAVALLLSVLGAVSAEAVELSESTLFYTIRRDGSIEDRVGVSEAGPRVLAFDYSDSFGALIVAQLLTSATPSVDSFAEAVLPSSSHWYSLSTSSQLTYGVGVFHTGTGNPPVLNVPLDITYSFALSYNITAGEFREVKVTYSLEGLVGDSAALVYTPGGLTEDSLEQRLTHTVTPAINVLTFLRLRSTVSFSNSQHSLGGGHVFVQAVADPYITFAPEFPYADQFGIVISEDIMNMPAALPQGGAEIIDSTGDGAGKTLSAPWSIAVDSSGNAYVSGSNTNNAFKVTPGGVITEIIDSTGDGAGNTLATPEHIAVDSSGNVYVTGWTTSNAFKITPGGTITEIINTTGAGAGDTLVNAEGITADNSGNVYVTGANSNNVFKITPGGLITEIIDSTGDGAGNTLAFPIGVAADSSGNIYVAGENSNNVFKITPGGVITEIIDSTGDGTGNTLASPQRIALDNLGNIYVCAWTSSNAFKITPGGTITEIIDFTGAGAGDTLVNAEGIAVDDSGDVYVTGTTSDRAFKITPGGLITEIIDSTGDGTGSAMSDPAGIVVDGLGNVYVAGSGTDNAFKITSATCGDGTTNASAGEVCDDGNTADGDGCAADCSSICIDGDGDDYGAPGDRACPNPGTDCDDTNPNINPDRLEICNGLDDDCDTAIDEGFNIGTPCTTGTGICAGSGEVVCDSATSSSCNAVPLPPTLVCRATAGDCDVMESCDGTSSACPADTLVPAAVECRASAGDCDVAEVCDGISMTCPTDAFESSGTPCGDGDACTSPDTCDGAGTCNSGPLLPSCDIDGDGVEDTDDNCPDDHNPDQSDIDMDDDGDVCDICPADPDENCDAGGSTAASVDTDGGVLETPDNSITMTIPPGALAEETSLSITGEGAGLELVTDLGGGEAVFTATIGPEGTVFDEPVAMVFRWDDIDDDGLIDGTSLLEDDLVIVKDGVLITDRCSMEAVGSPLPDCDTVANTFTFEVTSLSVFSLASLFCNAGDPVNFPGNPEICDGQDNDCDGAIDDGNPGGGGRCGSERGECEFGDEQCQGGELVCVGGVGPTTEICNGRDDDCDNDIDEGFNIGTPCTSGSGSCAGTGEVVCDSPTSSSCNAVPQPPTVECRAAAGDCDVAEHCDGASNSCPSNAFVASGTDCDDGVSCTELDVCDGSGSCAGDPNCDLSGRALYNEVVALADVPNTNNPIDDVTIVLSGDSSGSDDTGNLGEYMFEDQAGSITVTPTRAATEDDVDLAISAEDAALIAQQVVGLGDTFTAKQLEAADVSDNGALSSFDAALVGQRAVDIITTFATLGGATWFFVPHDTTESVTTAPGSSDVDFCGVIYGDVTMNWTGPTTAKAGDEANEGREDWQLLDVDQIREVLAHPSELATLYVAAGPRALRGDYHEIVLGVAQADGILGLDLALHFDPDTITIDSLTPVGLGKLFAVYSNESEAGTREVSLYSPAPMQGTGDFLVVRMRIHRSLAGLRFEVDGQANEGAIELVWLQGVPEGRSDRGLRGGVIPTRGEPPADIGLAPSKE